MRYILSVPTLSNSTMETSNDIVLSATTKSFKMAATPTITDASIATSTMTTTDTSKADFASFYINHDLFDKTMYTDNVKDK